MKRFLMGVTGAIALIGCAAATMAASELMKRGTVRWVDPATNMVGFEDGTRFRAAQGVDIRGLTPGTPVVFHYHQLRGGNLVVSYAYVDPVIIVEPQPIVVVPQAQTIITAPADQLVVVPEAAPTVITPYPGPAIIRPAPGATVVTPQAGQTTIIQSQ